MKKNKTLKKGLGYAFWFNGILFIVLSICAFIFLYREGRLDGSDDSILFMRNFYKTLADTNITVALGIAALLFSLVTINNKVNTNFSIKDTFLKITRPFLMFILLNVTQVHLAFSNSVVTSPALIVIQIIIIIVLFILVKDVYLLANKVLKDT